MSGTMDESTKNIVTYVGVGIVVLFILFAVWWFWRRSKNTSCPTLKTVPRSSLSSLKKCLERAKKINHQYDDTGFMLSLHDTFKKDCEAYGFKTNDVGCIVRE